MKFNIRIIYIRYIRIKWLPNILSTECWLLRRPLHLHFKTNLLHSSGDVFLHIKVLLCIFYPNLYEIEIANRCLLSLSINAISIKILNFCYSKSPIITFLLSILIMNMYKIRILSVLYIYIYIFQYCQFSIISNFINVKYKIIQIVYFSILNYVISHCQ